MELIKQIKHDILMIPTFLDMKNVNHQICKETFELSTPRISKLFRKKMLSQMSISGLIWEMTIIFNDISDTDSEVAILYDDFLKQLLNYYLIQLEEQEEYESCRNIKMFLDLW